MARIFPNLSDNELSAVDSSAEIKVYKAIREQVSDEFLVIFQPRWILKRESESARDGETDFLIAHPKYGYLTLEVKGGGIAFDGSKWTSGDRNGTVHPIKDPIKQAMDAKFAIRAKLRESNKVTQSFLLAPIGHAVFFTDIENYQPLVRSDMPGTLIGIRKNLQDISIWITQALDYWKGDSPNSLDVAGIQQLFDVLVHKSSIDSSLGGRLAELGEKRILLTQNQFMILDFISSRRRVAIAGGAGTGKTVLAVEKAKRLAADGFKTLLTCYNRELANHLAEQLRGYENIVVSNFHSLCSHYVTQAEKDPTHQCLADAKRAYPQEDYWRVQLPIAMSYALEFVNERFEAIVVDEGQDFGDEFWMPLEFLLSDLETSPFYIFYDTHQNLYSNSMNFPITESPFSLTKNCRNTSQIHDFAYRNYQGPPIEAPTLEGQSIHLIEGSNLEKQALSLQQKITDLLSKNEVKAQQIVVLIGDSYTKEDRYELIRNLVLPRGLRWGIEAGIQFGSILVDTVKRFKGLESEVVFIWGLPSANATDLTEVLYVGASRAISDLTFVGFKDELARLGL
jgi:hypothetical protein